MEAYMRGVKKKKKKEKYIFGLKTLFRIK